MKKYHISTILNNFHISDENKKMIWKKLRDDVDFEYCDLVCSNQEEFFLILDILIELGFNCIAYDLIRKNFKYTYDKNLSTESMNILNKVCDTDMNAKLILDIFKYITKVDL